MSDAAASPFFLLAGFGAGAAVVEEGVIPRLGKARARMGSTFAG